MPKTVRRWSVRRGIGRGLKRKGGVKGRGMYTGGRGGYWGRLIGSKFGKWGADFGDAVGNLGGAFTRRVVPGGHMIMRGINAAGVGHKAFVKGQGAYVANDALMMKESTANPVVKFAAGADGSSIEIVHNEYISDIFGGEPPGYFTNQVYAIQPGIAKTFPWLSQIAQNYQEYEFKQLAFTYKSTVSDFNSGTGQTGTVILCTQYNPTDEPFADKMTMLESDLCSSGKASDHIGHFVECAPTKLSGAAGKYTRTGPPLAGASGGQDLKTYDLGTLNVAVANIPSSFVNQSLGELHVSYRVVLRKVKQYTNKGWGQLRDAYYAAVTLAGSNPISDGFISAGLASAWAQPTVTQVASQQNNIGTAFITAGPIVAPSGTTSITRPAVFGQPLSREQFIWNATGIKTTDNPAPYNNGNQSICVVFPATAQGNYKITLTVSMIAQVGQTLATGYVNTAELWYPQVFGSCTPIADILQHDGTWGPGLESCNAVGPYVAPAVGPPVVNNEFETTIVVYHVRVGNPAGSAATLNATGAPLNAGILFSSNGGGALAVANYGNMQCEIEAYNTIGNYGQNGLSDEPVVVSLDDNYSAANGTVITTWPPAGATAQP